MGVSAPAVRNKRWQFIIDTCSNNTHMYIMAHIIMHARTDVGGAYMGRWTSDGVRVTL